MFDLIIIGGATAGLTSAIYAIRKKLKVLLLTKQIGGQSLLTDNIENYPGFKTISGEELVRKIREQVEDLGVEIKEGIRVEIDRKSQTLQAKIREATLQKIPFLGIIGAREVESDSISVRTRDGKDLGIIKLSEFLNKVRQEIDKKI